MKKMEVPRRTFLHLAAVAAALPVASPGWAQTYPSRPITIVIAFPPGGSTDVIGRILSERMRPSLGQSVVIENVGGANGSIGTAASHALLPTATPSPSAIGTTLSQTVPSIRFSSIYETISNRSRC